VVRFYERERSQVLTIIAIIYTAGFLIGLAQFPRRRARYAWMMSDKAHNVKPSKRQWEDAGWYAGLAMLLWPAFVTFSLVTGATRGSFERANERERQIRADRKELEALRREIEGA
jgi:hypothetical protein